MSLSRIKQRLLHIKNVSIHLTAQNGSQKKIMHLGRQNLLRDLLGLRGIEQTFKLSKFDKPFSFTSFNVTDFSLLCDLMIEEEYQRVKKLKNASNIIDIGSNIGLSIIYFHLLFPNANITGFEPDPVNFRQLRINAGSLPNVKLYPHVVGDRCNEVDFYPVPRRGVSSSLINRNRRHIDSSIRVKQVNLAYIFDKSEDEIDLLKFDVEGAEYIMFKNLKDLHHVKTYIGELHLDLMGCNIDVFCQLFKGYRVERERISDTRYLFYAERN